jgi:hypothetical protein
MNPDIAVFLIGAAAGAIPFVIVLRQIGRDAVRSAEGAAYLRAVRPEAKASEPEHTPSHPVPIEFVVGTAE